MLPYELLSAPCIPNAARPGSDCSPVCAFDEIEGQIEDGSSTRKERWKVHPKIPELISNSQLKSGLTDAAAFLFHVIEPRRRQVADVPPVCKQPSGKLDFRRLKEKRLEEAADLQERSSPDHRSALREEERRPAAGRCKSFSAATKKPIECA